MGILMSGAQIQKVEFEWQTGTPLHSLEREMVNAGARHAVEEIDKRIAIGDSCYALTSRQWEAIKREVGL